MIFSIVPFAAYITSLATNEWVTYNVLPGSQLRFEDDDGPQYIRAEPEIAFLTYNWTGVIEFGLWKYSLRPLVNETLGDAVTYAMSDCYQSPTTTATHHRVCPLLILARSFAICAPILTFISTASIVHIFSRQATVLSFFRCDALIFAFLPAIAGLSGWLLVHLTFGQDLSSASDFLPIHVTSSFGWSPRVDFGYSQIFYLTAWALQMFAALLLCTSYCRRPRTFATDRLLLLAD